MSTLELLKKCWRAAASKKWSSAVALILLAIVYAIVEHGPSWIETYEKYGKPEFSVKIITSGPVFEPLNVLYRADNDRWSKRNVNLATYLEITNTSDRDVEIGEYWLVIQENSGEHLYNRIDASDPHCLEAETAPVVTHFDLSKNGLDVQLQRRLMLPKDRVLKGWAFFSGPSDIDLDNQSVSATVHLVDSTGRESAIKVVKARKPDIGDFNFGLFIDNAWRPPWGERRR